MMKRCLCLLFALAFLILCSCGGGEEMTHAGIIPPPAETKPVEVDDTVYISAKDYYNDGYSNNYVVGIDKLGRSFDAALPKTDKERQVGIFYFLTLGQHLGKYSDKIYDTSKILQMENGLDLMFSLDALDAFQDFLVDRRRLADLPTDLRSFRPDATRPVRIRHPKKGKEAAP